MAWLITRHDDAAAALKDARFAKDRNNALTPDQRARQPWIPKMFRPLERNMLDLGRRPHEAARPGTRRSPRASSSGCAGVSSRLRRASGRGRSPGRATIRDYALPVPTTIIAEMLGVPVQDRDQFHHGRR